MTQVRYFEFLGFNNEDETLNILSLDIQTSEQVNHNPTQYRFERFSSNSPCVHLLLVWHTRQPKFRTSEVLGLSAEYFREIRTDAPTIALAVNDLYAACGGEATWRQPAGGDSCIWRRRE